MKKRKIAGLKLFLILVFVLILVFWGIINLVKSIVNPQAKTYEISSTVQSGLNKDLQNVIWQLAKQLKVPENLVRYYHGKDAIYFSFGINKNLMELYYANAVITGEIEKNGGKLVSGKVRKNESEQLLEFLDNYDKRHYVIRIYYGKEKYYPKPKKKLAIIIDDFGDFSGKRLIQYCKLDTNVTFAIIPKTRYAKKVMFTANRYNHETLIHIPMEPISYPENNPGKYAIYINQSHEQMKNLIEQFIKELPLCIGANNHMGSLITSNEDAVKVILKTLYEHNLFFIDSHTTSSSVVKKVANDLMIPCYVNNLFMDSSWEYTNKKLKENFDKLKNFNSVKLIIITHTGKSKKRYEFAKAIVKMAKKRGYQLIPASKLYKNDLPEIP